VGQEMHRDGEQGLLGLLKAFVFLDFDVTLIYAGLS